jgi:hypothetical protein
MITQSIETAKSISSTFETLSIDLDLIQSNAHSIIRRKHKEATTTRAGDERTDPVQLFYSEPGVAQRLVDYLIKADKQATCIFLAEAGPS